MKEVCNNITTTVFKRVFSLHLQSVRDFKKLWGLLSTQKERKIHNTFVNYKIDIVFREVKTINIRDKIRNLHLTREHLEVNSKARSVEDWLKNINQVVWYLLELSLIHI